MKKKYLNISIFGNTNNYPLRLALALKTFGHNVKLIINSKNPLHRPESLYPEFRIGYPHWIYDYSDVKEFDYVYENHLVNEVIDTLDNNSDFVILNDIGPSLAKYISKPHIVFLTGSDLSYFANFNTLEFISRSWDKKYLRSSIGRNTLEKYASLIMRQRSGIASSKRVYHMDRDLLPSHDELLDNIGIEDNMRIFFQMSNLQDLAYISPPKNKILTLLNGARIDFHNFSNHSSIIDMKGTNLLLEGVSKFVKKGNKLKLKMFAKGKDLKSAKEIIDRLQLGKVIVWIEEAYLFEFYDEISKVDLVCDQFGKSFPGLVTLDSYAIGRPVLSNFRNDIFKKKYEGGLPGFNASTSDEICNQLIKIDNNRDLLEVKGLESRRFAENNLSPLLLAQYLIDLFKN